MTVLQRKHLVETFHSRQLQQLRERDVPNYCISGWSSEGSQLARFRALVSTVDYRGGSVTDFGCGTGDLFAFLRDIDPTVAYAGYDCNAELVKRATRQYGAHFHSIPFDSVEFEATDYVFASGVFQFNDVECPRYYQALAEALFRKCRIGLAITFLSAMRDGNQMVSDEMYIAPDEAGRLASSLSGRWRIDHTYHPGRGDLTIGVLKEAETSRWKRPHL